MQKIFLGLFLLVSSLNVEAQNSLICLVRDSVTNIPLPGVTIMLNHTTNGTTTDANGKATLPNIPNGPQSILFSFLGYAKKQVKFTFPLNSSNQTQSILLAPVIAALDEIYITSTRTNARIEDLPIRVEVLGQEEMDEESTIVPGNITSILGDLAIITVQRSNPVNANDVIRMQGLDARYTQILRDGLPLYGGFSGSLGVLSIPPLDLRQVEIIKGSASTLYGGGAIGGLLNFISKTPTDSTQNIFLLNASTLKEYNVNSFLSRKWKKAGYTIYAGANYKQANDVNHDGFAEVPFDEYNTIHPRWFFYLKPGTDLTIGYSGTYNQRQGGDWKAIRNHPTINHPFLQKEKIFRNMLEIQLNHQVNAQRKFNLKSAGNIFKREMQLPNFAFTGTQYNSYTEVNNLWQLPKQSVIVGVNVTTEAFRKIEPDLVLFKNYTNMVPGVFVQHDWQVWPKLSLETGLRFDHHNRFGNFVLPRLSFFYKPIRNLSGRVAFGTGYKAPTLFDFSDPSLTLIDFAKNTKAEKSQGINADLNYNILLWDSLSISLNQAFYYTHINHINVLVSNTAGQQTLINTDYHVVSYGTDTYARIEYNSLELYVGYNHTYAYHKNTQVKFNMPFNPKDKFSTTLAYEKEGNWRTGMEASYSGNQYLFNNQKVKNYWFMAGMIEKKFGSNSLVVNCENIFDVRQSKYEPLVEGTITTPVFRPLWMPVEGRVVNVSLKILL
ncbi:TonB-dependent receptor [Adhaeribacter radiodurans]|uniref:TonB-dependent receptor n=1 Tax=Adhaeribacter radiodurans TaxID=2745197 RepID=A0A7L7L3T9_9BACT|nr:TonB-dependent receptor [Adhaeribacter radiodurans]QMU27466.1 TonB-dependent receptor [Adhaeribacter radiodurans]